MKNREYLRLAALALALAAPNAVPAQTYEDFVDLEIAPPAARNPDGHLLLAPDGSFYGVTPFGGGTSCPFGGCGTVFRMDATGDITTVHAFTGGDGGSYPMGDLLLASDGNIYGTTSGDGSDDVCITFCGTVFRIDTNGNFATLHTFNTLDGFGVADGLIEPVPGELWGTTIKGGNPGCIENEPGSPCGTVFRMHFDGGFLTMHAFTIEEGNQPKGSLVLGNDGNMYGVTSRGPNGPGTVFQITTNGHVSHVYDFDSTCYDVIDGLRSVTSGDLIGACQGPGSGVLFRLSLGGNFQILHSLADSGDEGTAPVRPMQASDALLYGVTSEGGAHGGGTIFQLTLNGSYTKLHDFELLTGDGPFHGLIQSPDGRFYGTAPFGGAHFAGVIYRLTMPGLTRSYCPDAFVRRDQMAVFLLKVIHGAAYDPPDCTAVFGDVACPSLFADWIVQLAAEGITAGCAGGNYCPLSPVTRGQMAVFLLKAEHGSSYTPPPCTGVFADVPCSHQFAAWIEQLFTEGITAGCGTGFCPDLPVTRAQMAVFLLKLEHGGSYQPPSCHPQFADVLCPSLFAAWIQQLFEERITAGCAGPP